MTRTATATGYADPAYAVSLCEYGTPRLLPGCQGSLLVRDIPGRDGQDAMGPYPLFSCLDPSQLAADVEDLRGALVAVSLVLDPFGDWPLPALECYFVDCFHPFKAHFVTDLSVPADRSIRAHHRRNVARARRSVEVDVVVDPDGFLDEWETLYAQLVRRHGIRGIAVFGLVVRPAVPRARFQRAARHRRGSDRWGDALVRVRLGGVLPPRRLQRARLRPRRLVRSVCIRARPLRRPGARMAVPRGGRRRRRAGRQRAEPLQARLGDRYAHGLLVWARPRSGALRRVGEWRARPRTSRPYRGDEFA